MYHSFLIHSSADGHLGCFHVLAIINSAEMNIGIHVSLSILVSSVCMLSSGIAVKKMMKGETEVLGERTGLTLPLQFCFACIKDTQEISRAGF